MEVVEQVRQLVDELVSATDQDRRFTARSALIDLRVTDPRIVVSGLRHPEPGVRDAAYWWLRYAGADAAPCAVPVAELVGDPVDYVRDSAVEALQAMGEAVVPLVLPVL